MVEELMDIESVIGNCELFLNGVFSNLKNAGFKNNEFKELDHIAYRTESNERYKEIKNEMTDFLASLSEVFFGGRLILVGRLKVPIVYENFKIRGIELMAPKENNKFKEGLEHAEFVIKSSLSEFLENHKNINFNLSTYNRKENPDLILEFDNCAAKFHTQSLLDIRRI